MIDENIDTTREEENDKKGAVCTSFGMILIILGALDCVLAWRGSFEVTSFYVFLLVAGIALYCIGSARAANDSD
ncbi:hypothetical protein MNBD_GAMMA26-880 [hydrothermal vent metagenome]|uniref:Uncharacterized protein n=1 Tax=hydrothermal vent metagenome TaxID=652676 RepID=A0A3B1AYY1_9ZZZZ